MGQDAKALPLIERAVRIRDKVLGPDHKDSQKSKRDLAAIRKNLGTSNEAQQPTAPPSPEPAAASNASKPSTPVPEVEEAAAAIAADACAGLSNGQSVKVPVKGYPQPQSALVLDSGGGKVSVRVMGMGQAAGKKLTLACSAVRQ
jgi:sRNA-binding protein